MINSMSIETAIAAAASFLVVAISHEVGHFLIAKLVGVPVIHLGVGFGPTLWKGRLWGETVIIVRTIPVGMSIGVPGRRAPDGSERRPAGHDIAVAAAGPTASYFLSLALFSRVVLVHMVRCDCSLLFSSCHDKSGANTRIGWGTFGRSCGCFAWVAAVASARDPIAPQGSAADGSVGHCFLDCIWIESPYYLMQRAAS
jgi:membrane-associated protease RseP (regulator of RpoE activity)